MKSVGMAAASATGEKLPMMVIGKFKKPLCFKNVKHLPCDYKSQKKSWMDSIIFEEWIRKLDRKFGAEKRKIAPRSMTIGRFYSVGVTLNNNFLPRG